MMSKLAAPSFPKAKFSLKRLLPSSSAASNGASNQSLIIAFIYFVFGCAWIIITDVLTSAIYGQAPIVLDINIIKGLIFIAISTAVIIGLIYPTLKKLVELKNSLQSSNSRLEQALDDLRSEIGKSSSVEKTLSETQQHAHTGSFDFEISSGQITCTDEALRICGIKREDFCGTLLELSSRVHPDDRKTGLKLCRHALKENCSVEFDCRIKNPEVEGQVVCARFAPVFDDNNRCIRILGTIHDITERRKVELAVIKERNRAQMYLDVAAVIFIGINENAVVTLINNAGCKLLCYTKEEVLGKTWTDNFVFGSSKAKFLAAQDKLRSGNDGDYMDYENSVMTGCGEKRIISWRLVSLYDEQGNYCGIIGSGVDITDELAALNALRESESSKSFLLSHLPGMAYRCSFDQSWTMKFLSDGCYKLTGYWPESFINNMDLSYNDIICPEYRDEIWDIISFSVTNKESFSFEYEILTASGERKWVMEVGRGIFDDKDNAIALEGIVIDVSKTKER